MKTLNLSNSTMAMILEDSLLAMKEISQAADEERKRRGSAMREWLVSALEAFDTNSPRWGNHCLKRFCNLYNPYHGCFKSVAPAGGGSFVAGETFAYLFVQSYLSHDLNGMLSAVYKISQMVAALSPK